MDDGDAGTAPAAAAAGGGGGGGGGGSSSEFLASLPTWLAPVSGSDRSLGAAHMLLVGSLKASPAPPASSELPQPPRPQPPQPASAAAAMDWSGSVPRDSPSSGSGSITGTAVAAFSALASAARVQGTAGGGGTHVGGTDSSTGSFSEVHSQLEELSGRLDRNLVQELAAHSTVGDFMTMGVRVYCRSSA